MGMVCNYCGAPGPGLHYCGGCGKMVCARPGCNVQASLAASKRMLSAAAMSIAKGFTRGS